MKLKNMWTNCYPHPSLPSAVIGTMDGRLLILAIEVPSQNDLDLEDLEDLAKAKVSVKFIASICLHGNPIDQIQVDPKPNILSYLVNLGIQVQNFKIHLKTVYCLFLFKKKKKNLHYNLLIKYNAFHSIFSK